MKKIKAKIKRYFHCLYFTIKEGGHRLSDYKNIYYMFGIPVWSNSFWVGCECGKCFYQNMTPENAKTKKELDNLKNVVEK